MSYLDTLRPCKYTSPSGQTFDLMFEELSRDGSKKLQVNEPPQQDRAEVTDLGNSGIRLPMTLYISGMDYTATSDAFFVALSERYTQAKPATLSHPRWGDILVCPTSWTQVESFVDGMGQAVFTVEFIRVDREAKFPATGTDAAGQLQADIDAATSASQSAYTENGVPSTPGDIANVTAKSSDLFTDLGTSLSGMASAASDLGAQFQADLATALASVDALVAAPEDLALAVMSLARAPADALIAVSDKVRGYQTMLDTLTLGTVASYAEAELLLLGLCASATGASEATLSGDLGTRGDAVESSDLLDAMLAQIIAAIEAAEAVQVGWAPDAQTVSLVQDMVSTARARLLEESFSLKTERRTELPASMDPNSAVFFLYGRWSDDLLTQFGKDNDLQDDEWFMLPARYVAVWYA